VRIGNIIGQLVQMNACSVEAVAGIVAGCCREDKAAEQDVPLEMLTETYDRLLSAIRKQ